MAGQDIFSEALVSGARDVFETMIYMEVEECSGNYDTVEEPAITSSIDFKGRYCGSLGVTCDIDTAKVIANNMLGTQGTDELKESQINDAMGEVANMVLGSVKAHLFEVIGDVKVTIPRVFNSLSVDNNVGEDAELIETSINLDDSMATLTLFYKEAT